VTFDLRKTVNDFLDATDLTDFREMAAALTKSLPARELRPALTEALAGYIANANHHRRSHNVILCADAAPRTAQPVTRSPKVAAIAAWHQRALRDLVHVGKGDNKPLGDCTYDDLMFAATERREIARLTTVKADRYEWLAKQLHAHNVDRVADLPSDVLTDMEAVA
jgi:hypothetical protein